MKALLALCLGLMAIGALIFWLLGMPPAVGAFLGFGATVAAVLLMWRGEP